MKGCFTKIKVEANKWKRVGMVAGGSGLTPCLQVAEELLSLPDDKTKIDLIFCNKNEGDIFLKDHLDSLAAKHDRFTVKYCVDKPLGMFWSWTGGLTGYVDADMVKAHLPPPSKETSSWSAGRRRCTRPSTARKVREGQAAQTRPHRRCLEGGKLHRGIASSPPLCVVETRDVQRRRAGLLPRTVTKPPAAATTGRRTGAEGQWRR